MASNVAHFMKTEFMPKQCMNRVRKAIQSLFGRAAVDPCTMAELNCLAKTSQCQPAGWMYNALGTLVGSHPLLAQLSMLEWQWVGPLWDTAVIDSGERTPS